MTEPLTPEPTGAAEADPSASAQMPVQTPPPDSESAAQVAAKTTAKPTVAEASVPLPGWERATLEKLAFATLHEQRLARRWRNGMRLAWQHGQ